MSERVPFQPDRILEVLVRHRVEFVLIGGMAAAARGSPHMTWDVDVCPKTERENLERLAGALVELDARIRAIELDEPLPFDRSAEFLARCQILNLATSYGDLDLSCVPSGTAGFNDLRTGAEDLDLSEELVVCVASLADIVRSKEAAGREKDRITLPTLRAMLERQERG
jgi:hypothetical protein